MEGVGRVLLRKTWLQQRARGEVLSMTEVLSRGVGLMIYDRGWCEFELGVRFFLEGKGIWSCCCWWWVVL